MKLGAACLVMAALPYAFASRADEPPAIRGVVIDAEGHGVEGASIYVEEDPARPRDVAASTTDAAGAFEIPRASAPRVLLRVAHAGADRDDARVFALAAALKDSPFVTGLPSDQDLLALLRRALA